MPGAKCLPFAVRSGQFAICPLCGKKLCVLRPGSFAKGIEIWCKLCKTGILLDLT